MHPIIARQKDQDRTIWISNVFFSLVSRHKAAFLEKDTPTNRPRQLWDD